MFTIEISSSQPISSATESFDSMEGETPGTESFESVGNSKNISYNSQK